MSDLNPTQDDLVAYLRGELPAAEAAAIDSRLARDERLRALLERTREVMQIVAESSDESTVRRVNDYFERGIRGRASDIHLDLEREGGVVRLRVDGVLHEVDRLPLAAARATLARLKAVCGMVVEDNEHPQDGRCPYDLEGRKYDLRGSFLPGIHGGRACVRIFDRASALVGWERLGLFAEEEAAIDRLLHLPHGLIAVTGPTGSGKTTVLYEMVNRVAGEHVNVLSVEDPVEYDLPWVAQTHINAGKGVTFPYVMRAIMRQDPDVVMVGEIRDRETAEMAVQLAMTGHLVMTTLHTYNAVATIHRLLDIGLEPFLVSSTLRGVVAVRLVRKVCGECATEHHSPISAAAAAQLGIKERELTWRSGAGCDACRGTGFRGRVGLYEVVEVSSALADAIAMRAPDAVLREQAFLGELPTMQEHAARLVAQGVTTPEEAARVISINW